MPKTPEKRLLGPENSAKLARFTRKNASAPAQNSATKAERIRAFMARFDLSRAEAALVLCTPERTLDGWLDDDRTPPGCMIALLDVIEQSSHGRRILGVQDKQPDAKIRLYAQNGPDWTETEVRGWWKDRLFIKIPDCFCYGGNVVELDRRELWSKRCASHDGYTYFTPDGKEREDAENAKTIAAGQMTEVMYIHYCAHEDVGGKFVPRWRKQRVFNMNERWIFFYWDERDEAPEYVERKDLDSEWGASSSSGWRFYSDTGLRAKQKYDEEFEAHIRASAAADKKRKSSQGWLLAEDAITLGIGANSTEAEVIAAFRGWREFTTPTRAAPQRGSRKSLSPETGQSQH